MVTFYFKTHNIRLFQNGKFQIVGKYDLNVIEFNITKILGDAKILSLKPVMFNYTISVDNNLLREKLSQCDNVKHKKIIIVIFFKYNTTTIIIYNTTTIIIYNTTAIIIYNSNIIQMTSSSYDDIKYNTTTIIIYNSNIIQMKSSSYDDIKLVS